MKLIKLYIFFLLISFFTLPSQNLLSLDNPEIKEIENYLNKLNNITSNFIQTNSNGLKAEGKIFLSKPGKLRIEYKKKDTLLIVADGKWLHYFDIELNEKQSIIIEKSPAWVLLKKKVNLEKDFIIEEFNKKNNQIFITLSNKNLENIKKIKLVFLNKPLTLKKWIIYEGFDTNKMETSVTLLKINKQTKFDSKTFLLVK